MSKIIIPTPLRKFTNEQSTFIAHADTVGRLLGELVTTYPGLKMHLLDSEGKLRSFVKVYVGEDDINSLDGEQTALAIDTTVSIIPAIAGGTE